MHFTNYQTYHITQRLIESIVISSISAGQFTRHGKNEKFSDKIENEALWMQWIHPMIQICDAGCIPEIPRWMVGSDYGGI